MRGASVYRSDAKLGKQCLTPCAGRSPRLGFEGGQTPLRQLVPKRGFHNPCALPERFAASML